MAIDDLSEHDTTPPVDPEWLEQHAREYASGYCDAPSLTRLDGRVDGGLEGLEEDDPRLFEALGDVLGYKPSVFEVAQWLEEYRVEVRM